MGGVSLRPQSSEGKRTLLWNLDVWEPPTAGTCRQRVAEHTTKGVTNVGTGSAALSKCRLAATTAFYRGLRPSLSRGGQPFAMSSISSAVAQAPVKTAYLRVEDHSQTAATRAVFRAEPLDSSMMRRRRRKSPVR